MARPYHSPSSIALGQRCPRAWALNYIAGERDPDVEWTAALESYVYDRAAQLWRSPRGGATVTSRSRSTALGKAVHATFERWYDPARGAPDWRSLPGQIATSACHLLPHPTLVEFALVEKSIGRVPIPATRPHAPKTVLEVHGTRWGGYRDLAVAPETAEAKRLGWPVGINLADYKSVADIARYALTPDELERDVQGNLYALDMCEDFELDVVPAHWIYLETKKVRRAHATHATMTRERALNVLGPCAELSRELDSYTSVEDAPQNPSACNDYGPPNKVNCPHAKVNGGKCDVVKRSFGALIQLSSKKKKDEITMALSAEAQAKFDKIKAEAKAKAAAASGAPAESDGGVDETTEAEAEAETSEPEADEPKPEADEPKPEPVKAATPAKPKPVPATRTKPAVPASGAVGVVLSLHGQLEAAEAKRAAAQAELFALLGEIKAALA